MVVVGTIAAVVGALAGAITLLVAVWVRVDLKFNFPDGSDLSGLQAGAPIHTALPNGLGIWVINKSFRPVHVSQFGLLGVPDPSNPHPRFWKPVNEDKQKIDARDQRTFHISSEELQAINPGPLRWWSPIIELGTGRVICTSPFLKMPPQKEETFEAG
jgi:hypothetical protein